MRWFDKGGREGKERVVVKDPRVSHVFFAIILSSVILCSGLACSGGGDGVSNRIDPPVPPVEEDEHWYNNAVFKPVWGDFNPAPQLMLFDTEKLKELYLRGRHLTKHVAACGQCHAQNPVDPESPLIGGWLIKDRFGKVRSANITSDRNTGIGTWDIGAIVRAFRASINKNGAALSPDVHRDYRWMADRDAKAIAVFLLASPPQSSEVRRRDLGGISRKEWGIFSQHTEFEGYVPAPVEKGIYHYGRYLTHYAAGCKRCHTPPKGTWSTPVAFSGTTGKRRGLFSALGALLSLLIPRANDTEEDQEVVAALLSKEGKEMYHARIEENKEKAKGPSWVDSMYSFFSFSDKKKISPPPFSVLGPDIRGTSSKGLRAWSSEDMVNYLGSGITPQGSKTDPSLCPWSYFQGMTTREKRAIALYLKKR